MPVGFLGTTLVALALTNPFVVRSGAHLMLDDKPFRFGGANVEWLGVSDYGPASATPPRYATHAEVDAALTTAQQLGARVVRSQTLADSVGCAVCIEPTLHSFNATAFAHVDYAIAAARKRGLKLIATIIGDDAAAGGSGCVYLGWRGYQIPNCSLVNMAPFFTDPQVLADVDEHIAAVLNHVNVYTHVAYKNDPTILGWDLMNGGGSPPDWTKTIADYVRSIDTHHLILSDASNAGLKNVDACVSFIYPHWKQGMDFAQPRIDACAGARKPYIAYEYGWDRTNWPTLASFRRFLATLASNREVAGDAFWALELRSRPIPADVTDPQEAATGESGEWWALTVPPRATLVNTVADMRARTAVIVAHNRTMASTAPARRRG
jgi:mannan endo-1,4-beta-mannosidase